MKVLLGIMAVLEVATGAVLLVAPELLADLLFGVGLGPPPVLTLSRLAGGALLALGMACWLARHDVASRAGRGVLAAMLIYNTVATVALAQAGAGLRLDGALLWPAVVIHSGLTAWCAVAVWRGRAAPSGNPAAPREGGD